MNGTLKQIRVNALGFSVKEMAEKLNMSVSEYERIEKESLSLTMLGKVAQATGKNVDFLLNVQKEPIKFDIRNSWLSIYDIERKLSQFLMEHRSYIDSESLLGLLKNMVRKPRIAFVGRSDAGKSTLINTLLGSDTLPVSWTPTTSIIFYVKHIKDKPSYINGDVAIFHADENNELWDDTRLSEREYTESYLITTGDYSLLKDYGSRQGCKFEETNAVSAVVFVNADILANCDLVDLPGFGTGDREKDDSLLAKIKGIDILIYMSAANQFMQAEDIARLQNGLPNLASITLNNKSLKPLSNIYVVASQAHAVDNGSIIELNGILDRAVCRFDRSLSPNYWNNLGQDIDSATFRKRFFTYSTDQESLRRDFDKDLRDLLEKLPHVIVSKLLSVFKDAIQERISSVQSRINSFREILSDRGAKKESLEKMLADEPNRINKNAMAKQKIFDAINRFKQDATVDFVEEYNRIINKESILNLIKSNDFKKKEEDMKLLGQKLSNLLNDAYSAVALRYSQKLSALVDEYIHDFAIATNLQSLETGINGKTGFDFKASFAGGLAGVAVYGALAVWAAGLGNLGAYILVAKGVSLLAALGIGISGGTAAAISAVAAIGGPVVIVVGLAVLVAASFYAIFAANWKETMAKNIVKEYDKKKVLENFKQSINKYWDDTKLAFVSAADNMEKKYKEYLKTLEKEINEVNDAEIDQKIAFEEKRLDIYSQLINNLTE